MHQRGVLRVSASDFLARMRARRWLLPLVLCVGGLTLIGCWEAQTSTLQSRYLAQWAAELAYDVQPGSEPGNRYPAAGPFDERLGYTRIPELIARATGRGFEVVAQARQTSALTDFMDQGFFPPYAEKAQGGLDLLDCRGEPFFTARFPQQIYASFESIPPLVVQTLAFIENREALAGGGPRSNPAVEWRRLGRAVLDRGLVLTDADRPASGGSTLATQLEKFRHSPQGRTAGVRDKYRQMVSASVRAYRDGEETAAARQRIVLDYVNSLPLGAQRGHGEVNGLLDGLREWWGADPDAANRALRAPATATGAALQARAQAYREVLSLLIAQRRPSLYLGEGKQRLDALTDSYLRVLAQAGVIDEPLRDAALQARLEVVTEDRDGERVLPAGERKAASATRIHLAAMLDTARLYDLDRLDLRAISTLDGPLQSAVTASLRALREPEAARAAGLTGFHLLGSDDDPGRLFYSFTLYESRDGANRVRVQTDNLNQPFDLNTGAKLELGSTAKLRTLVSYLEIVAALHERFSGWSAKELARYVAPRRDNLSRWAVQYLQTATDKSLPAMLQAAMERRYSASPGEQFFTGGGLHSFENFEPEDNARRPTVAEAFRDSINLVFIRLMRDVVQHLMYHTPWPVDALLEDKSHPDRVALLQRFADEEGSHFMRGFFRRYQGQSPERSLELLVGHLAPTPRRLAAIYRSWTPEASFEDFSAFVASHPLPPGTPGRSVSLRTLYDQLAPGKLSLADRGYLARVHPLELWTAVYLREHPKASLSEVLSAGRAERQTAYSWLLRSREHRGQNIRILSLIEHDAFVELQKAWHRLGYPFDSLVPSYATAIGSSGDRPAALAELIGIIVNEGLRQPTLQLEQLQFAAGTPYEALLHRPAGSAERVMTPEVAAVVRQGLSQVVELGTARRLRGALTDAKGAPLAVGGKTGTGDNRFDTYNARGVQVGSRVINRTATFVFFIGPRHFGVVTVHVPGQAAGSYKFTSALPVQVVKSLAPLLGPVASGAPGLGCAAADGPEAVRK